MLDRKTIFQPIWASKVNQTRFFEEANMVICDEVARLCTGGIYSVNYNGAEELCLAKGKVIFWMLYCNLNKFVLNAAYHFLTWFLQQLQTGYKIAHFGGFRGNMISNTCRKRCRNDWGEVRGAMASTQTTPLSHMRPPLRNDWENRPCVVLTNTIDRL